MKKIKIILIFFAFLSTGIIISSCGNSANNSTNSEQQGKEYTSAYVCPMHCESSGSEQEGKCPVCGMDYVKNEDHKSDEHKH